MTNTTLSTTRAPTMPALQTPDSRRQSSLPLSRSAANPSPAIRRVTDRAPHAPASITSFSPFPKPQTVPMHATRGLTPISRQKRALQPQISFDAFPKPPANAPMSPASSSSSAEATPQSSRQTSDSYGGGGSVGKDSSSSTLTSNPLTSPAHGMVSRGRTSFGVVSPSVVPARSAVSQEIDTHDNEDQGTIISVRVRPETGLPEEDSSASTNAWYVDSKSNSITHTRGEGGDYIYDNVFADHDQNSRVYNSCAKRLVRRVMEGYQGTVFAYGMTGSGKTFSMYGTSSSPGIIPMSVTDIFACLLYTSPSPRD